MLVGEPVTRLRQGPADHLSGRPRTPLTHGSAAVGHEAAGGGAPASDGDVVPPVGGQQQLPSPLPQAPPPPPPALPAPSTGAGSCGGVRASDGGPYKSTGIDLPVVMLVESDSDDPVGSLRLDTGRSAHVVGTAEDPAVAPD